MENENADAADNDRGQHHLEQRVVAQPQLRDDDVGVGEIGARCRSQPKTKPNTMPSGEQRGPGDAAESSPLSRCRRNR